LFGLEKPGMTLSMIIFGLLFIAYLAPLTVDLGKGMALLSNTAMTIAGCLMLFVILTGPTSYIMSAITGGAGDYFSKVLTQGFQTLTFYDEVAENWFESWTLTYMVWCRRFSRSSGSAFLVVSAFTGP